MNTGRQRGFTLIELLVVIAIIGILSSVVLASLNTARQKGRDARRISDIKQLQLALELNYDSAQSYPAALSTLSSSGYITTVPTDPSDLSQYAYVQLSSGSSYVLCAQLEVTSNNVLSSDSDTLNQAITLRGAATNVNANAGNPGTNEVVYCVQP